MVIGKCVLTFVGIGLDEVLETDLGVHLDAEQQRHLQQDALHLANADVVDCAGAKLSKKLLGSQRSQVFYYKRPQV